MKKKKKKLTFQEKLNIINKNDNLTHVILCKYADNGADIKNEHVVVTDSGSMKRFS